MNDSPYNQDDLDQFHEAFYGGISCPQCDEDDPLQLVKLQPPDEAHRLVAVHQSHLEAIET